MTTHNSTRAIHSSRRPATDRVHRRTSALALLEGLEERCLMTGTSQFLGITPVTNGVQDLESFTSGAVNSVTNVGAITGLNSGDVLKTLSTNPTTGQVLGVATGGLLGTHGQLYSINPTTAAATPIGTGFTDLTMLLSGTLASSINPTTGALNVLSPSGTDDVVNTVTGTATSSVLGTVTGLLGGLNPTSLAYTNPVAGATSTVGYVLNSAGDVVQTGGTSGSLATLSLDSPLNLPLLGNDGDLVVAPTGNGYVAGVSTSTSSSGTPVYTVNLLNNTQSLLGIVPETLSALTVVPSTPAASFKITGLSGETAGTPGTVTVTALDSDGNVATGYTGTVHFTSSDPNAILPANATLTNGVGTFSVDMTTAGTQSLTVTDTSNSSETGTETGVVVSPAATSHLVIVGAPGGAAGTTETFTVTAEDAYGNVTPADTDSIHFTSTDPNAVFSANPVTLTNGTGTYQVDLKTAGLSSITATDTSNNISATEAGIVVTPAAASQFTISGLTSAPSGTTELFTVTAKDPYGNVVTGYTGTVHFTSSDPTAVLPANSSLVAGSGIFSVTLKTVGTQSVTATDTVNSSVTGTASGLVVTSDAATRFALTGLSSETAGSSDTITITAKDINGNTSTSYNGTVRLTSNDPQAVLPVTVTLVNGVGTFNATFKTAGLDTVTATDTVNPLFTGTISGVSVAPAATTHYVLSGMTSGTAGTTEALTVTADDNYGNVTPSYSGTVHFTSTDTAAVLPVNSTLTNGVGVFPVTLGTAGTQTYTATDTSNASITGSESGIVISPGPVVGFTWTGLTGGATGLETVVLKAVDALGNIVTDFDGSTGITVSDPKAIVPATVSFVDGIASLPITFETSGNQTITATLPNDGGTQLVQTLISAGTPTQFVISGVPTVDVAGTSETMTVTAEDPYGNVATGYTGTVHFTSSDPQAVLPADTTLTNGVGTFSVDLKTAGIQSITATDTTTPSLTGSDAGIVVDPAAASSFVITGLTSPVVGGTYTAQVEALDPYGNVATGYTGTVHITSTDPAATVASSASLLNGVGSFSIGFGTAGVQSLTVTDTTNSSLTGSDSNFTVAQMIWGTVYLDLNADGVQDDGEPGMAGRVVYLDVNNDAIDDGNEPSTTTNALGQFFFPGYAAGSATVVENTSTDLIDRDVVDQTSVNANGSISIGVTPISTVAPLPIVPSPFNPGPSADPTSAYVQALYHAVLGRDGATSEISYWVQKLDAGMTRQQVAQSFVDSPEHYTMEVDSYYSRFLKRLPDSAGVAYYVNRLESGATEMSVVESFLLSPEFENSHQTSESFVTALYDTVLARYGEPAEIAYWTAQMAAGMSRAQVQTYFVESPEELRDIVIADYAGFLHRAPDSLSSSYTSELEPPQGTPSTVAVDILSSPEFFKVVTYGGR